MDGYQVAKRVREEPYGRDMLLLALTGGDSSSRTRGSSAHGFDYHLSKPVDVNQLAILLNEGTERSRRAVHL